MKELYQILAASVAEWRDNGQYGIYPETRTILRYIKQIGYLRQPQIEALESYIYLKEVLNNKPTSALLLDLYKGNEQELLASLNLSQDELMTLALSKDRDSEIKRLLGATYETWDYSNYVFALAMGAGKTILMGTMILYDFVISHHHPDDMRFGKNALVFAPDTTIINSLREIKEFDYSRVLPKEYFPVLLNVKYHYLESTDTPLNPIGNYNIIVSNSQKIILKTQRKIQLQAGLFKDEAALANQTKANKRLVALETLNNLLIFVDEAHHSYGKTLEGELKKTKETINYLHKGGKTPLTTVVNMTGTPYVENRLIKDVVYTFGLKEGIETGILKQVRFYDYPEVRDEQFIEDVVKKYLNLYGGERIEEMLPKIAFYSPSIESLQTELRPFLEKLLTSLNIPIDTILEFHIRKDDEKELFKQLDTPESNKRFILLVNKGTEGWNCRSLVSCAMYRNLGSTIFLLQSAARCLRSCGGAQASIFLSTANAEILDKELQKNFNVSMGEMDREQNKKVPYELKVIKKKKIQVRRRIRELTARKNVAIAEYKLKLPELAAYELRIKVRDVSFDDRGIEFKESYVQGEKLITSDYGFYEIVTLLSLYTHIPCLDITTILKNSIGGQEVVESYFNKHVNALQAIQSIVLDQLFTYEIRETDIKEEIELTKRFPFSVAIDPTRKKLVVSKGDLQNNRLGFHIDPYVFDSLDEKSLFVYLQDKLKDDEVISDLYFTGGVSDSIHNDFSFEYWKPQEQGYRRYFPDFLVETSMGRYIVIEVKDPSEYSDYKADKERYDGRVESLHNEVFAKEIGFEDFRKVNKNFEYHLVFNAGLKQRQEELLGQLCA